MNTSNTKLTKSQKVVRKFLMEALHGQKGEIFSFPENNCTVVIVPEFTNSNMARVSVSYSSDNEQKFRAKVGEYYALSKMFDCQEFIKVPLKYGYDELADRLSFLC